MNNDSRKRLTEYLGECWHEWKWLSGGGRVCKNCGIDIYEKSIHYHHIMALPERRTFTTAQDMLDLFKRLRDRSRFLAFYSHCIFRSDAPDDQADIFYWIATDPSMACQMVADFLQEANNG